MNILISAGLESNKSQHEDFSDNDDPSGIPEEMQSQNDPSNSNNGNGVSIVIVIIVLAVLVSGVTTAIIIKKKNKR